ncbi:MAG: DUF502 domain-containing protein [Candidatus Omnitrophota bacterium]
MMSKLRRYFLTGLAVLLPIVLTGYIIFAVFNFADNLLGKHINRYLSIFFGFYIPGLGLLITALIIIVVGFFSSNFLGKRLLPFFENILLRIPLVHQIYPSTKKIISFFFSAKKQLFKQVVLVEYPRKGIWSLAFITNEGTPEVEKKLDKEMLNIFIPGTPGPLTGYFMFVPKEDVIFLDISVEDALKLFISGGVLNP